MKIICFISLLLIVCTIPDKDTGYIQRKLLSTEPHRIWFESNYNDYEPNIDILKPYKDELEDMDILVFMGTWCSDSRREVPRLLKITDHLNLDEKQIKIYLVDDQKMSEEKLEVDYDIDFVPTIIFLKDGEVKGRIVESPSETLEKDIKSILLE